MARTAQDVTDAELAVLQVLWDRGAVNRRLITDVLYPATGLAHYTTVQKLLERLHAKGYVREERGDGAINFAATVPREELISRRLQTVADKLCDGSLTPLLTNLIRARPFSPDELQELRNLIEMHAVEKPKGKRR